MSIRHALLALLTDGPQYGLRLRAEFEARTGEVWPLNVGQVYSTLRRLERDELIEPDGPEDVREKSYRLLPAGRDELETWLASTPPIGQPDRNDLVMRILIAASTPGIDVDAVIQRHRRHLVSVMQEYTRLKADAEHDTAFLVVADAEIFRAEADIRWLDACEVRLAHRPITPPDPIDVADDSTRESDPQEAHR